MWQLPARPNLPWNTEVKTSALTDLKTVSCVSVPFLDQFRIDLSIDVKHRWGAKEAIDPKVLPQIVVCKIFVLGYLRVGTQITIDELADLGR